MEDTIFSKIIRREVPAQIVYEDEHTLAFLDAHPINPGHTLVVPKKAVRNIFDVDPETFSLTLESVRKVAKALQEALSADGINIHINNEAPAGQAVFHLHIHVIPRYVSDGFKHWQGRTYSSGESEKIADKIRQAFA
ncbi:MAG: Diadenosine tetraphosphate (Ap4A) hydrolase related family hydrolase, Hit-like protein involved [Parcubacteria group bacterium]|nr:Diadenosine tetraphosphate (Ap4A) hydrolase related family hydrolase, Hit-like protein involved [Parcubacteria group bacterium]